MSWKSVNGQWTWVDDGQGDPANPPTTAPVAQRPIAPRPQTTVTPTSVAAPKPAPTAPIFTAGNPTPVNNPDLDPVTGQPRQITPGVGPNGQPTSIIRNTDGSAVVTQNGQIVQRIDASGQVTTGAPAPTGTGATSTGAAPAQNPGAVGYGNSIFAAQPTAADADKAAFDKRQLQQELADWVVNHPGASTEEAQAKLRELALKYPGTVSGAATTNYGGNPTALSNQIFNQTSGDIARVSEAGALGQQTVAAAGDQALATGNQIYGDAQAQRLEAIGRGDAGLATAQQQGAVAQTTARDVAAPLFNLGANEQAYAADARGTANTQVGAAGTRLASADAAEQRLMQLAATGDPEAVAALRSFQGSAGTAGAIADFNPNTRLNDKLAGFQGSAGTAGELDAFRPNIAATGQLGAFQGNNGTADDLASMDTSVGSTGRLGAFEGNAGNAAALEGVDTGVSATGNLLGFQGSRGTADTLATLPTGVAATGALGSFQGTGGMGLERLERFASGADIGPSAAEALRNKQSDATTASNIAIARSGRGAGDNASAMRQALFANAGEQQQLGNDLAAIRATEAATARGQSIGAATAAAGTSSTLSGQKLSATQAQQQGQLQAEQDRLTALVESGKLTQAQASQQLDAFKTAQQGQLQSVAQKSTNLATAGEQRQTQAAQQLDAIKSQQAGELQSMQSRLSALVSAGQMTQAQAQMQLDALKAKQEGELSASAQRLQAVTSAGTQLQTQSQQQLSAQQTAATNQINAERQRLDALVASGQMSQKQADQQLAALQSALQGETAAQANRINASTAAGATANASAGVSADLAKAFATLGLQYDVNSGNVYNQAGQLVQGGDKIAADLLQSGLTNQVGQGANAVNATAQGVQALTNLTNTNANARQAVATIGVQTAGQIAALSQGELGQLSELVRSGNALDVQKYLGEKGIAVQAAAQDAATTAAVVGAIGAIVGGLAAGPVGAAVGGAAGTAVASDVRLKKDVKPSSLDEWLGLMPEKTDPDAVIARLEAMAKDEPADDGGSFDDLLDARPAKGFKYRYKNPKAHGAAPGEHFGPMAGDMLKSGKAIASAVGKGRDGMLNVDPQRAGLAAVAGLSEEQRRNDKQDAVLAKLMRILREAS